MTTLLLSGCLLASSAWFCASGATPDEPPRVFHVSDFGAIPDTPDDMGPALREAIAAAAAHPGPAVVRLDKGTYRVAPGPGETSALPIRDVEHLELEGAGPNTLLVVTDPGADAVRFQGCHDVRIAQLAIDYDPVPFTQGTVMEVAEDTLSFTMQCDPGYLLPDAAAFTEAHPWGLVVRLDPDGGGQFGPVPVMDGVWSKSTEGIWRCTVPDAAALPNAGIRPGERYVYMARTMGTSAVAFWACSQVNLESVTVHAAPSLATVWGLNEQVQIRNLHVGRPVGSERLLSTNADGIHCLGNRGELLIEGCTFEAMADDAINIHARASAIIEQPAPNQLLVNEGGCVEHRVGDRLQLYDPGQGIIRSESLVVTEVTRNAPYTLLTLNETVPTVMTGATFQESDHLFDLDACGAGAVIRNNTFGPHRGRGVLLKTTDCLVEGNTFRNREGWGITLHQLQGWGEGPAAQRILIRGNTFVGAPPTGHAPCIDIRPSTRTGILAEGLPVCDIRIEENRFINPSNGILAVSAARGVTLNDNRVEAGPGTRPHSGPLVAFRSGTGFRIQGLQIQDLSGKTTTVVQVEKEVAAGPDGLTIETIETDPPNGLPLLEDHRP